VVAICIPCILKGENLQILPHSWAISVTLNSCYLKTRLQIEKNENKCIWLRLFLTITARLHIRRPSSCWEWCAVFFCPEIEPKLPQEWHFHQHPTGPHLPIFGRDTITWYFHATSSYNIVWYYAVFRQWIFLLLLLKNSLVACSV